MISLLAVALATCSAIAWYAASPHCMWRVLRGRPRMMRIAGSVLAVLSLGLWVKVAGGAAGLCAMLASAMLALIVQPWLALFAGSPDADATAAEKD